MAAAMNRLFRRYGLFYVRYMDDFVILALTPKLGHQISGAGDSQLLGGIVSDTR